MKRLCDQCKEVRPISPAEREMLAPFTDDIPERVAAPVGCSACLRTGFFGREGVYEVLRFDAELAEMVRDGAPIAEIRAFARRRGDFLVGHHGIEKIRDLTFAVKPVYEGVLVEEGPLPREEAPVSGGPDPSSAPPVPATEPSAVEPEAPTILIVEDDVDTRALLQVYLEKAGYGVVSAEDGVDALLKLGREKCDLILSDINMPNLDGLKLLEIVMQQGVGAPVVFLSADEASETELNALEIGAADFIRKPIQKDVLLHRIKRVLGRGED